MTRQICGYPDGSLPKGVSKDLLMILDSCRGKEKAISRELINETLERYHNYTLEERAMRLAIENIRNMGIRLCDLENGAGLFIAETQEEYDKFKMRYGKHAFSLIKTIRAMDKHVSVETLDDSVEVAPVQLRLA